MSVASRSAIVAAAALAWLLLYHDYLASADPVRTTQAALLQMSDGPVAARELRDAETARVGLGVGGLAALAALAIGLFADDLRRLWKRTDRA